MQEAKVSAEELAEMARENVPLVGTLAMQVETVLPGAVTIRVPYQDEFVRPGGTVSGPVLMAVADFAMYGVVLSLIGRVDLAVHQPQHQFPAQASARRRAGQGQNPEARQAPGGGRGMAARR